MRIHTHHGKDVFLIRFQMLYRTHIIILSIFLFSLGVLFQLKGDFGDPYFQQIAFVVTWLPVVLFVLIFRYQLLKTPLTVNEAALPRANDTSPISTQQ